MRKGQVMELYTRWRGRGGGEGGEEVEGMEEGEEEEGVG